MNAELIKKYFPSLSPEQFSQYERLYDLYVYWNERINVISRKDIDQLYLHHVLHSLAIAKVVVLPAGASVLDFGTGGGFPGIPLAIMFPQAKFHLVDSIAKKIRVVNEISNALKLNNITATHSRVEELKGSYDYITCRAVAPLTEIYGWTKKLINNSSAFPGSGWILLKGGELNKEIKELGRKVERIPINSFFGEEYFNEKYVVRFS